MAPVPFSVSAIRELFPALRQKVYGKQLIYFDNGATSQKPQVVLDTLQQYYALENANIHRGVHYLSQQATSAYEAARRTIQHYIGAKAPEEIIFTKGTTDGINLVAYSFGERLKPGDEILISAMEHHSNIVPWQLLCERKGCTLRVIPISKKGELDLQAFEELLSERTKLLAITHISNTLGTINPVKELIEKVSKLEKENADLKQQLKDANLDLSAERRDKAKLLNLNGGLKADIEKLEDKVAAQRQQQSLRDLGRRAGGPTLGR